VFRQIRDCDAALQRRSAGSRRNNRRDFVFSFCPTVWPKSDQTSGLAAGDITILCVGGWLSLTEIKSAVAALLGRCRGVKTALSPECHKASPKMASHIRHRARDCYWTIASACSPGG
jgi:hypothetical protein